MRLKSTIVHIYTNYISSKLLRCSLSRDDSLGAEESVRIYAKESNFCYGCSAKTTITEDCRIGDKTVSSRSECFTCSGTGLSMPAENCCKRCSGRLVVDGDEKIKTFIPMGAYDGYRHIITKKGNEFPGKQRGCVIVNVMEEKHGIFK